MAKRNTPPAPRPQPISNTQKKKVEQLETAPKKGWLLSCLAVLAITFALYLPSLSHGFVNWDDPDNLVENKNLDPFRSTKDLTVANFKPIFSFETGKVLGNYNPMPVATFAVEKSLFGLKKADGKTDNARPFHLNNVLLHLVVVFFCFRLMILMGFGNWAAIFGSLLMAIHPMRVESVSWVTERKDVLFGAFFFASLFLWARWIQAKNEGRSAVGLYVGIVVLNILGCFSKVQMVTLPLSMLALDYWFKRELSWQWLLEKIPFFGISLLFGYLNIKGLADNKSLDDTILGYSFFDRLAVGGWSYFTYLYKLILPYPLSPLYPYPKQMPIYAYFSMLVPIGIAIWWFRSFLKNTNRELVFAIFFFTANIIFLLQIKGAGQGYLADRFTYAAYFGFFVLAAWLFDRFAKGNTQNLVFGLSGSLLLIYAVHNVQQQKIWKDGETLWSHVIKFEGKTNPTAWANRAQIYRDRGDFDRALKDYNTVINEITRALPKSGDYNSRGKCYFDMAMGGKFPAQASDYLQRAMADYNKGVELVKDGGDKKSQGELYINRGAANGALKNYPQAISDLSKGLEFDPKNENGYLNRSLVYYYSSNYDKAMADYSTYISLNPFNADIYYERGLCKLQLKMVEEAVADFTKAISLKKEGLYHLERARGLSFLGRKAEAQADIAAAKLLGKLPDADLQSRMAQ